MSDSERHRDTKGSKRDPYTVASIDTWYIFVYIYIRAAGVRTPVKRARALVDSGLAVRASWCEQTDCSDEEILENKYAVLITRHYAPPPARSFSVSLERKQI